MNVRGHLVVILLFGILAACSAGSDDRSPISEMSATSNAAAETCANVPACTPQCNGRTCGLDPVCGVPCGTCADGAYCSGAGQCTPLGSIVDDLPPPLPQQPTADLVGDVASSLQVSESGQAVYSIPLEVPAGVQGLAPNLGLQYTSVPQYGAFGMVGFGWSLTGLSSIERCPISMAQSGDGFPRPIRDDVSDRFCLDGRQLVAISGGYGQDGTEYRTEIESFTRVISRGQGGSASPANFIAYAKDGRVLLYGSRDDATQSYFGSVRRWALSEVQDRSGNAIEIHYRKECNGEGSSCKILSPDEILYGMHGEGDARSSADRKIKFVYGSGKDARSVYTAGQEARSDEPLSAIESWVGDSLVRTRTLGHDNRTDITRLSTLYDSARDVTSGVSVSTSRGGFTYDDVNGFGASRLVGQVDQQWGNGLLAPFVGRTIVLDVNGDGYDDILYPKPTKHHASDVWDLYPQGATDGDWGYYLAIGTGEPLAPFQAPIDTGWGSMNPLGFPFWCIDQGSVFDYNGDGRDDILSSCGHKNGVVLVSNGINFDPVEVPELTAGIDNMPGTWLADLNGDSWPDALTCVDANRGNPDKQYLDLRLSRGPGRGFEAPRRISNYAHDGDYPRVYGKHGAFPCEPPMFIDIDGDGIVNAVKRKYALSDNNTLDDLYWTETWQALKLTSDTAEWVPIGLQFDEHANLRPDTHNPDEDETYLDIFTFPEGLQSASVVMLPYAKDYQFKIIDVNGDNLPDVLRYTFDKAARIGLYLNTGRGFRYVNQLDVGTRELTRYEFARSQVLDWDRDGRQDLLVPLGDPKKPKDLTWQFYRFHGDPTHPVSGLAGTWELDETSRPVLADFDGDGNLDMIRPGALSGEVDPLNNYYCNLFAHSGQGRRHTLVSFFEGHPGDNLGRRGTIAYNMREDISPTTRSITYAKRESCPDRVTCLGRMPPLVSSYTLDYGGTVSTSGKRIERHVLWYEDARVGGYGRGFLGFRSRSEYVHDENDHFVSGSVRLYDNSSYVESSQGMAHWYPFAGGVVEEGFVTASETEGFSQPQPVPYSGTSTTSYVLRSSDAGRPFVTRKDRHAELRHGHAIDPAESITDESSDYDAYGNQKVTVSTLHNANGTELESESSTATFEPDESQKAAWLISLPRRISVTSTVGANATTRTQSFTYTSNGLLQTAVREPDDAYYRLSTTFDHDPFGNVIAVHEQDATGASRTARVGFDARGLFPIWSMNAEGHLSRVRHEPAYGRVLTERDPNGVIVQRGYDAFYRLAREISPLRDATITYKALPTANLKFPWMSVTTTEVGGAKSLEERDALGRAIHTETVGYQNKVVVTDTEYDGAGRITNQTFPHLSDNLGSGGIGYRYDLLGRVTEERRTDEAGPDGWATTLYRYGLPSEMPSSAAFHDDVRANAITAVAVTDPAGRIDMAAMDHRGRAVASQDAAGALAQYTYGPFDALLRANDPAGNVTTWTYEPYGATSTVQAPDSGRHEYRYSAFGEPIADDHNGNLFSFGYDRLGRKISQTDASGTTAWKYDGPGPNAIGKLTESISPDCVRKLYDYEPPATAGRGNRGLLARETQSSGGRTYRTGFAYDDFGRLARVDYPEAGEKPFAVEHTYDDQGLLTEVRQVGGGSLWTFVDAHQGYRVRQEALGDGTVTTHTFGESGRETAIQTAKGQGIVQGLAYVHDTMGNVKSFTDALEPSASRSYEYDALDRVRRVLPGSGGEPLKTFDFDVIGNITHQSGVGDYVYGAAAAPHAVTAAGANRYEYDAAGDQKLRTGPDVVGGLTQEIAYTPFHLPKTVTAEGGADQQSDSTTFLYDADQQRVAKKNDSCHIETRVIRLPPLNIEVRIEVRVCGEAGIDYVGEHYQRSESEAGIEHTYFVYAEGGLVAAIQRNEEFGEIEGDDIVRFFHPDTLGSPQTVTDATGTVIHRQHFSAYGENEQPKWDDTTRRGFTGHRHDDDLGLIDMRGRSYDPRIGRFLSADPVWQSPFSTQGFNRYAYVFNNPLKMVDPSGYQAAGGAGYDPNLYSGNSPYIDLTTDPFTINVYGGAPHSGPDSQGGETGTGVSTGQSIEDVEAGRRMVDKIRGLPGDVSRFNYDGARGGLDEALDMAHGFGQLAAFVNEHQVGPSVPSGVVQGGLRYIDALRNYTQVPEAQRTPAYHIGEASVFAASMLIGGGEERLVAKGAVKAGEAGRFAELAGRRVVGDMLTPHHMPQAALELTATADGGALVMTHAEHALTRTYAGRGIATARAEAGMPFRNVLARDIRDVRKIVGTKYDAGLRDLLRYYRKNFPELMKRQ